MAQWTPAQVHDTVAAIVAQPAYGGRRQSLLARFLRFVFERIDRLLEWVRGSLDARIIIAIAVIGIVIIVAARVAIDRRAAARRARGAGTARRTRDRRDPWTEAGTLADAGRFADASHAVYAAVVDALTAANVVRYHRSKTAGDYARDLHRAGSPLARDFRAFGRAFDRLAFGLAPVTRDDYDRFVAEAERIVGWVRHQTAA
jgi:hypothetical protein